MYHESIIRLTITVNFGVRKNKRSILKRLDQGKKLMYASRTNANIKYLGYYHKMMGAVFFSRVCLYLPFFSRITSFKLFESCVEYEVSAYS